MAKELEDSVFWRQTNNFCASRAATKGVLIRPANTENMGLHLRDQGHYYLTGYNESVANREGLEGHRNPENERKSM